MSSSDGPGESADTGHLFAWTVRGPEGNEFTVQATTAVGMAGPLFIGHGANPLESGPVLRVVNCLLARVQQPRPVQSAMVMLIRKRGDEGDVVFTDEATRMTDAQRKVLSIAGEVQAGTSKS